MSDRQQSPLAKRLRHAELMAEKELLEPKVLRWAQVMLEIKELGVYLDTFPSWDAFCTKMCHLSAPAVYRALTHAKIVTELETSAGRGSVSGLSIAHSENPVLPATQTQTRELRKAPEGERLAPWQAAVASANGQQPTPAEVHAAVLAHGAGDAYEGPDLPKRVTAKVSPAKNGTAKSGTVLYDDREFATHYGKLVRFFDLRHQATGAKSAYEKVRYHMNGLHGAFKAWQKESS